MTCLLAIRFTSQHQTAVIDLWTPCQLLTQWNDPVKDIQIKLGFQPGLFFITLVDKQVIGSIMEGYDGHRGARAVSEAGI